MPPAKPLLIISWVLFGFDFLLIAMLAYTKNAGDDAAGRGVATGYAVVLGAIMLVAGGLLLWGSFGGPKLAFWVGFCAVAAPAVFGGYSVLNNTLESMAYARDEAQYGKFDDARLTTLARAIDRNDTATVRTLLAKQPPDWKARDARNHTIFGHAIYVAIKDYGAANVASVKLLIDAGAPVTNDVLAPHATQTSITDHNLVYHLYYMHNASANAILELVLAKGLSPNQMDEDGRPIYFSIYTTRAALDILARHGADFTLLDSRADRLKQNALMNSVALEKWPEALFFLERGLSPDYAAPDGRTARTLLAEVAPPGKEFYGDAKPAHEAFVAALARQ